MLYQRSQFSNGRFRKLLQKRFKQPFSSAIQRSNKRFERLDDLGGLDVKSHSKHIHRLLGRYYPAVSGDSRGARDDDSLSDEVLQNLKRNSERLLRQYTENIFNNQRGRGSRRGGVSQTQNFAQIAALINRGVSRNK